MHMLQGVKRAATVAPKHLSISPIWQETNVWPGNIRSRIENALSLASDRYAKTPSAVGLNSWRINQMSLMPFVLRCQFYSIRLRQNTNAPLKRAINGTFSADLRHTSLS